jgi:hypothetical protein
MPSAGELSGPTHRGTPITQRVPRSRLPELLAGEHLQGRMEFVVQPIHQ